MDNVILANQFLREIFKYVYFAEVEVLGKPFHRRSLCQVDVEAFQLSARMKLGSNV